MWDEIANVWAHYSDVIMSAMASQTSVSVVCLNVCSGADKKHESSVSLAFVRESNAENVSIRWRHHMLSVAIDLLPWAVLTQSLEEQDAN